MIHYLNPAELGMKNIAWTQIAKGRFTAEVEIDGYKITLRERVYPYNGNYSDRREYHQTTRVYGAIDALVPEFMADEPFQGISIPGTPTTEHDKMRASVWNAWKRATTKEAGVRLTALLRELTGYGALRMPAEAVQSVKFSQKAGCTMCPCSPGFVLGATVHSQRAGRNSGLEHGNPVDIYIEKA